LEHLNKTYGTDILITDHTYEKTGKLFKVEEVDRVAVRGKSKPVTLYAVLGMADDKDTPSNIKELRKMVGIEFNAAAAKKG
jgi:adenylate cyclase